jgi:hypothetical protein
MSLTDNSENNKPFFQAIKGSKFIHDKSSLKSIRFLFDNLTDGEIQMIDLLLRNAATRINIEYQTSVFYEENNTVKFDKNIK